MRIYHISYSNREGENFPSFMMRIGFELQQLEQAEIVDVIFSDIPTISGGGQATMTAYFNSSIEHSYSMQIKTFQHIASDPGAALLRAESEAQGWLNESNCIPYDVTTNLSLDGKGNDVAKVTVYFEYSQEYKLLDDAALMDELNKTVNDYAAWIDKEIPIDESWSPEVDYLVMQRGYIHDLVEEVHSRTLAFDTSIIRTLDEKWQMWIAENTDKEYVPEYPRQNEPKRFWWEWVDQLDILTDEQKGTI